MQSRPSSWVVSCTISILSQLTDFLQTFFQRLYDEEQILNDRLEQIKAENSIDPDDSDRIDRTLKEIDKNSCELLEYNDILTRKLIECVRVVSKTEIQIIFKGGYEVTAEVEK